MNLKDRYSKCVQCNGTGAIRKPPRHAFDRPEMWVCDRCEGTGIGSINERVLYQMNSWRGRD